MNKGKQARLVILSVDDDQNSHFFAETAFQRAGLEIDFRPLADGDQAIRYFDTNGTTCPKPDLVLLDLKMPTVSGLEVLAHLRNFPEKRADRVILLSSSDDQMEVDRAYRLGCDAFVRKPSDFYQFVNFVRAISAEYFKVPTNPPATQGLASFFVPPSKGSSLSGTHG